MLAIARCPEIGAADSGGGDVHAVGLAVLDHLGVAAAITTPARAAARHGAHFGFQNFGRQAGFEDVSHHQRLRSRAGNRQIVHGSVHRQFADRAAGKAQRLHHEAVGGDGEPRSVDVQMSGVAERPG